MAKLEDEIFTGYRGRNGADPPFTLLEGQCREALNVEFYRSSFGRKRGGASNLSLTGGTGETGPINQIFKFEVDSDKGNNELWSVDSAATEVVKRLAGGTTWADVTLVDNFTDNAAARGLDTVSFNGKLFMAYDTSVNRLHVYDPADAKVRRCGLATPAAATVADTGSGSYAATIRYYKVTYLVKSGSDILRRSQLSPNVSFTPSGSGTAARVTKPASISEDETHWEVYGSPDDNVYYLLSEIVVGTTTYDDSTDPSAYTGDGPPLAGTNVPPPSAKYLIADDARIIMAGAHETAAGDASTPSNRRVWWTALLGTNDIGDDERVPDISGVVDNFIDVEAPITGLGGPLFGAFYAFSYRRLWKFVQTGNAAAPYLRIPIGPHGCVDHKSIIMAEDQVGNPAMYWISPEGPRCLGINGVASLVDDIHDLWENVNLDATSRVAHGVYYAEKNQVWWWVATGASNTPNEKWVFDVRKGQLVDVGIIRHGWSYHNGNSAAAMSSVMFSETVGASMSGVEKPYIARSTGAAIWKLDTGTNDAGTNFQAYIDTQEIAPAGPGRTTTITEDPYVHAEAAAGVTLQLTVDRDYGVETTTSTASIAAGASETRVRAKFEGTGGADLETVKFRVGDAAAADNGWNVDSLTVPMSKAGRDGAGD